jgi:hypothetical protein
MGMSTLAAWYGAPDDTADDATRDKQVLALASRIYGGALQSFPFLLALKPSLRFRHKRRV